MNNKTKLKLDQLKVESFITSVEQSEKQTIEGMDGEIDAFTFLHFCRKRTLDPNASRCKVLVDMVSKYFGGDGKCFPGWRAINRSKDVPCPKF